MREIERVRDRQTHLHSHNSVCRSHCHSCFSVVFPIVKSRTDTAIYNAMINLSHKKYNNAEWRKTNSPSKRFFLLPVLIKLK